MAVQARFYVSAVTKRVGGSLEVTMHPSTRGECNKEWAHYSPSGEFKLNVHPESAAARWFEERLGFDLALTFEDRPRAEVEAFGLDADKVTKAE